jgi:hypothetical protein
MPDETTTIQVGGFNIEHLWIDNTLTNNASWAGFWGNNAGHVVDGQIMRDGGQFYLWGWNKKSPATVAFIDVMGVRTIGGGGIGLLGKPVFGNSIRYNEIVDFRYYPNFHIQPTWLFKEKPQAGGIYEKSGNEYGIYFKYNFNPLFKGVPETAPLRDWNIIEGNHVYDGPNGILIESDAKHTIVKRNTIGVNNEKINNLGINTIIK